MAVAAKDLQEWLESLEDGAFVFVDDGGLTLRAKIPGTGASFLGPHFEVGGEPDPYPVVIDWTHYGMYSQFETLEAAQQCVRESGKEFANVTLTRRGNGIVNERGETVGYFCD